MKALRYRDFRLFWIGQGISMIGTQMQLVGLNWHIYLLTKSAVALGFLGLMRFVPILLFGLLAGPFVDTRNRKHMLIVTETAMTIFSLILVIATLGKFINPWIIYAMSIATAIATAFDLPARQSLMPNLVDRKDFASAISLGSIMFYTSAIIGPALAGFVIARFGVGSIYLFNTVSFLAVLTALFLMKTSGEVSGKKISSVSIFSLFEGLRFVKSKSIIWSTMLLDFFSTFFASASALLPIFAQTVLNVGPIELGLLYAAQSVGAVVASGILASRTIQKQGKVLLIAVIFYAFGTILFGASRSFVVSFIGLVIVGAGDSVSAIIRTNIRQLMTPDRLRGRMTSINMIFFMGGPQLGEFEAGIVAAAIGAPLSVITGGIGTIVVVAMMALALPALRNYENQDQWR